MKIYLKNGRRIEAYIQENGSAWLFCLGKPSDASCLSCSKPTLSGALDLAHRFADDWAHEFGKSLTFVEC